MTNAVFSADQLREDIDLEAKRAAGRDGKGGLPVDVWETYSAFANTDGGVILLGVSENDGQLSASGIREPDRVVQDLWSILTNPEKVSLLPEGTLRELRARFGPGFDRLDDNSRVALATAQIEGFVTNARLQQICPVHRRDITELWKTLVDDGFLVPDGRGRATSCRVLGRDPIDLAAPALRVAESPSPTHKSRCSAHKGSSPTHMQPRSAHLASSSAHLRPRSAHSSPSSAHSPSSAEMEADLEIVAAPVRANRKVDPQTMRNAIVELCRGRFLTLERIASLLDRSAHGLRQRFIKPMVEEGLLERRFPQQPNHEDQAYRTHEAIDV